jgi:hypothetical protein
MDWRVVKFLTDIQYRQAAKTLAGRKKSGESKRPSPTGKTSKSST